MSAQKRCEITFPVNLWFFQLPVKSCEVLTSLTSISAPPGAQQQHARTETAEEYSQSSLGPLAKVLACYMALASFHSHLRPCFKWKSIFISLQYDKSWWECGSLPGFVWTGWKQNDSHEQPEPTCHHTGGPPKSNYLFLHLSAGWRP